MGSCSRKDRLVLPRGISLEFTTDFMIIYFQGIDDEAIQEIEQANEGEPGAIQLRTEKEKMK